MQAQWSASGKWQVHNCHKPWAWLFDKTRVEKTYWLGPHTSTSSFHMHCSSYVATGTIPGDGNLLLIVCQFKAV